MKLFRTTMASKLTNPITELTGLSNGKRPMCSLQRGVCLSDIKNTEKGNCIHLTNVDSWIETGTNIHHYICTKNLQSKGNIIGNQTRVN